MVQDGGKVVSHKHRPLFTPQEILLVLIYVGGWVDLRAIVRSEGFYVNEKSQWHNLESNQRPSDLYCSAFTTMLPRFPYFQSSVIKICSNQRRVRWWRLVVPFGTRTHCCGFGTLRVHVCVDFFTCIFLSCVRRTLTWGRFLVHWVLTDVYW